MLRISSVYVSINKISKLTEIENGVSYMDGSFFDDFGKIPWVVHDALASTFC